jgi:Flp pilus assembly protein CpaB
MSVVATSSHTYWSIALIIGLVAALAVAGLLGMLLLNVARIQRSVNGLLETAGKVGQNTANIPQLEATAPVLALIAEEAVVQDGYMSALTDGFGEEL